MRQPLCWMDMAICREKDMAVGIYVLHLHSCEEETRQSFLREALECVDPVRRSKTERLKGTGAKAASLGAGMLLQKIAMDLIEGIENTDILFLEEDELLAVLQARMFREQTPPFSFSYEYGEQGKPQIVNFPKKFNLSHSGDYVVCGVSDGEVGVDIQNGSPSKIVRQSVFSQRQSGNCCRRRARRNGPSCFTACGAEKKPTANIPDRGSVASWEKTFRRAQMEGKEDLLPGTDFGSGVFAGGLLRNSRSVKFKENGK